jgi:hypothetical protein
LGNDRRLRATDRNDNVDERSLAWLQLTPPVEPDRSRRWREGAVGDARQLLLDQEADRLDVVTGNARDMAHTEDRQHRGIASPAGQ